ncbi:MAG: mechanosensitive ion channel [Bacilli bacterium]|nr:mechanosensitive ion channel [Bacilli bacterium]
MNILNYVSDLTSIETKYLILIIKTILFWITLDLIKKLISKILRNIKDSKKEYVYNQKIKIVISICKFVIFLLLWSKYLSKFLTLISFISAGFTIALRDLIFNFFSGIYIKIAKPFVIEDRIEIDEYKGDVVNINTLSFELLEVNNHDFIGQSTGVITHVPNSKIFSYPLRNYNKAFKYIWNEITVNVPLSFDINKAKGVIYRVVNNNDVIKNIPDKMKKQINNISTDYRIYFNKYSPVIYTKVVGDYVEYTVRYLVNPKKARYVNSSIWKHILIAYQNGEIELYSKDNDKKKES